MKKECHICNSKSTVFCSNCQEPVCEECLTEYTEFNRVDYDLCKKCEESHEANVVRAAIEAEYMKAEKEEKRKKRNSYQKRWYNSEKQKEKRKEQKERKMKEAKLRQKQLVDKVMSIMKKFNI